MITTTKNKLKALLGDNLQDFETAINVIKFIKPKIYFKGPDYKDLKGVISI